MTREISTRFCLIEPDLIRGAIRMKENLFRPEESPVFPSKGKPTFAQTSSQDDNGVTWSQRFQAVTNRRDILEYNRARMYVGLILTDGSLRVIGTADDVPVIIVTPHEQGWYVVNVNFKSQNELIL